MNRSSNSIIKEFKKYICNLYPEEAFIRKNASAVVDQALFNLGIRKSELKQGKIVEAVYKELDQIILAVEPEGLSPFKNPSMIKGQHAKNVMKYLLHEMAWDKSALSWDFFKKVFSKESPQFLLELRKEFAELFLQLQSKAATGVHHDLIVEMYIGNLLSLYAFTNPHANERLSIPCKIGKTWRLTEYRVDCIEITPDWFGEPMEAIGLMPICAKAAPKLLFRGTPLPGAKAWHWAELADFTPGYSLGQLIYTFGKDNLKGWIEKAVKGCKHKVQVYGQSLGGALAYQIALHHPEQVEIHGYVPPGLYSKSEKIKHGKVYCHADDLIYLLGEHPAAASMIKVITEKRRDPYHAHVRIYGSEKTILLKVNTHRENRRPVRKALSLLHQCYSVPFFTLKLTQLGVLFAAKQIKQRLQT